MEYVLGPVLALLLGMKFTHYSSYRTQKKINAVITRLEASEKMVELIDKQTLQKMVVTLQPVAGELQTIKDFVGLQ